MAWARWLPFLVVASLSVWASGRAPQGRRAPHVDWSLTWSGLAQAATKRPHIVDMLVLFLLAVLAVGLARRWVAAALTLTVGVLWELVQTTVVGHDPRLVDLLPDLIGIGLGLLLVWAVSWLAPRFRGLRTPGRRPATDRRPGRG